MVKKMDKRYRIDSRGVLYILPWVTSLKENEFRGRKDFKKVIIPPSIKHILPRAFFACQELEEVEFLPNSQCESIGVSAFNMCINLRKINFPHSLKRIGSKAFIYNFLLEEIELKEKTIFIGDQCFEEDISIKRVVLKNPKITCGYKAFWGCSSLRSFFLCGEKKDVRFLHWGPVLMGVPHKFNDGTLCSATGIDYIIDGKPQGEKYFYFFLDGEKYIGIGSKASDAFEEANFLKNNTVREKAIKEKWDLDTPITSDDYRAISGACFLGVSTLCKNKGIGRFQKVPIRDVLKLVSGTPRFEVFEDFVNQEVVPNQKRKEEREAKEKQEEFFKKVLFSNYDTNNQTT